MSLRPLLFLALSSLAAPLFAAGCSDDPKTEATGTSSTSTGSGGSGGDGGGSGGDSGFLMAPHTPFPTLTGSPSAVIAHPKLVSILFEGNPYATELDAAAKHIMTSDWLAAVGADYGVGLGEHLMTYTIPGPAPTTLDDPTMLDMVDQLIQAGTLPPPGNPADVIYVVHVPAETSFDDGDGYIVCDGFYGYHWQYEMTSGTITYAIVGDCDDLLDDITGTLAHEIIEAATDPGPDGGYYLDTADDDPWVAFYGSENADLCDYAPYHVEGGFAYQRSWGATAAAAAASSPCVPSPADEIFFDVSAEPAKIVNVAAGQSAEFTLTGWSTAPMADWNLTLDPESYSEFVPDVLLDKATINNGKTVKLTVSVPAGTPPGQLGAVVIYSGDDYYRYWPVAVMSQ